MSVLKFIAPATVLLAGVAVSAITSYAKPEYVKETKKGCTFCHVDSKKTPKDLTEAGKFYKEKKTLDGFTAK